LVGAGVAPLQLEHHPSVATVPGVGYHPKHTPRARQAVVDLFGHAFQMSASDP
jgi:hypothetical protein